MSDDMDALDALVALVASSRELVEAIRMQAAAIHALAEAIAVSIDDDGEPAGDVDRYMDGTPVAD